RLPAVPCRPVRAKVVAVGNRDLAVRVQVGPERVEGKHRLVDTTLGVETDVWVSRVGPARRHLLIEHARRRLGGGAVVALDDVVAVRAPVDVVAAEIEVVAGRELVEEELRRANQLFATGLDRYLRLRVIGVEVVGARTDAPPFDRRVFGVTAAARGRADHRGRRGGRG